MQVVTKDIERPLPIVIFLEVRIDASLSFLAVSEEDCSSLALFVV